MTLSVHDVARYFLAKQHDGDISNLKLQKLCYYAQGMSLAMRGCPLWTDYRIKAWRDGPVVPDVWHAYKERGWRPIPRVHDLDESRYDPASRQVLDMVSATFGKLSATRLRDMTHAEPPWREAWERARSNEDDGISNSAMRAFFSAPSGQSAQVMNEALWGYIRQTQPDWDREAAHAREEIASGQGLSLEELRRRRAL